ncbi:MAG: Hint domain-containing protein [Pseudomonadota bacterium]
MSKAVDIPAYSLPVYVARDFTVINGANLGDAVSFATELDLDDTYDLRVGALTGRLSVLVDPEGHMQIAPDTRFGTVGSALHIDSCLTMMSSDGRTTEVIVLVEVDAEGDALQVYILPLAELKPRMGYALVGLDTQNAHQKFAEMAYASLARGTRIATASGALKPVEELRSGDVILTRDDGPQKIAWIGQSTVRAVGEFAPIRIQAGAMNNEADLLLSPDHRLFVYQRSDAVGAGRSEILVRARHLVDGDTVMQDSGGFIEYYQLLFERHQIVYAEGIAVETLFVDPRTRAALPAELGASLGQDNAPHGGEPHAGFEIDEAHVKPDLAKLLKDASKK